MNPSLIKWANFWLDNPFNHAINAGEDSVERSMASLLSMSRSAALHDMRDRGPELVLIYNRQDHINLCTIATS